MPRTNTNSTVGAMTMTLRTPEEKTHRLFAWGILQMDPTSLPESRTALLVFTGLLVGGNLLGLRLAEHHQPRVNYPSKLFVHEVFLLDWSDWISAPPGNDSGSPGSAKKIAVRSTGRSLQVYWQP